MKNFDICKVYFFLLISLPITCKIVLKEGIYFYPQEFIMILLVPFSLHKIRRINVTNEPYFIFGISVFVMILSTIISQLFFINLNGFLKCAKYLLYIYSIIVVANYNFLNFSKYFNLIGIFSISTNLIILFFKYLNFSGDNNEFFNLMQWDGNYIASGLSNLNYDFLNNSFTRSKGNHGLYGSYLVIIYIVNFNLYKKAKKNYYLIIILMSIISVFLLNSRETLLLLIVSHLGLINFHMFTKLNLKRLFIFSIFAIIIIISVVYFSNNHLGVFRKLSYTINSFTKGDGDKNIIIRFNTWKLIFYSLLQNPILFLSGTGYNESSNFFYLNKSNNIFKVGDFVEFPENFFLMFLYYGGLFAFIPCLIYWLKLFINILKCSILSKSYMYPWFLFGLFLTNNTGGSMFSDIFLSQFALFYLYIMKCKDAN